MHTQLQSLYPHDYRVNPQTLIYLIATRNVWGLTLTLKRFLFQLCKLAFDAPLQSIWVLCSQIELFLSQLDEMHTQLQSLHPHEYRISV